MASPNNDYPEHEKILDSVSPLRAPSPIPPDGEPLDVIEGEEYDGDSDYADELLDADELEALPKEARRPTGPSLSVVSQILAVYGSDLGERTCVATPDIGLIGELPSPPSWIE